MAPKKRTVVLPSSANALGTPTRSKTQRVGPQGRTTMRTLALDYGNRISLCEVTGGQVVARATVDRLEELTRWLGPTTAPARVAVEACREAWWIARKLKEWGHEPVVVDATRVKQLGIGQHRRKNDRIDAEVLARSLENGLIPRAHILSEQRQELRLHLSVRRALIEARAQYITTVRGLVRAHGHRMRGGHPASFVAIVREARLDAATRALVSPLLEVLDVLNTQIAACDAKLEVLAAREPIVTNLKTVPGVGTVIAAAFVSVIDDPSRFERAHQVESYVGLVPSEHTSGKRRLGAISKHGNPYLRALLVQAAWTILRMKNSDPLREWGREVMRRRGGRVAVVALARRVTGVLWAIWRKSTVYEPSRVGHESASGMRLQAQSIQLQAALVARAARKRIQSSLRPPAA